MMCLLLCGSSAAINAGELLTDYCQAHIPRTGLVQESNTVPTLGTNRVLVIRARMQGEPSEPFTVPDVNSMMAEADRLFRLNSYGKFALEWVITPTVTLPHSLDEYQNMTFHDILQHAREAAKDLGYDHEDYHLDLTRHTAVAGWRTGEANIGVAGARVGGGEAWIVVHELGHNLGFVHANFWNTISPQTSPLVVPPFPSNHKEIPNAESIEFDPDSLIGWDSIIGPGENDEYGDHWDIMGSGQDRFNAVYRHQVGWLPGASVIVPTDGVTRLYEVTCPEGPMGKALALRIPTIGGTGSGRDFWVQYNPGLNDWFDNGVQIHWGPGKLGAGPSQLLDFTPGTLLHRDDSALPTGKTFSWRGMHLTPLAFGQDEHGKWIDVATWFGTNPANRAPVVSLTASAITVDIDQPIQFHADAYDPDGDPVAVHWDFGDLSTSGNKLEISKKWKITGEYSVLCTVSDMRGGETVEHIVVSVGDNRTTRITGLVLNDAGHPITGARVHNGIPGRGYAYTFTDSRGAYTLTNIQPGSYPIGAFLFGYTADRPRFASPLEIDETGASGVNFILRRIPEVTVSAPAMVIETDSQPAMITFKRFGNLAEPLTVVFGTSGTAEMNRDYSGFLVPTVTFPPGAAQVEFPIQIFNDTLGESDETIVIDIQFPGIAKRNRGTTNEYSVYIPGWDLKTENDRRFWVQTSPEYLPASAAATLTIIDDDEPIDQVISAGASDLIAIEDPKVESAFIVQRSGNLDDELEVAFDTEGTAVEGVDYEFLTNPSSQTSRTIRFVRGESEIVLPVVPISDGSAEGIETVILRILPRQEYGIEIDSATVQIRDDLTVPMKMHLQLAKSGDLSFEISSQAGKVHVLQQSVDLREWTGVRTNILFTANWMFTISKPEQEPLRFYRVLRLD